MSFKYSGKYGPLLIAEIGGNHEGNYDYAIELIKLAIDSGADCIKLQIYSGDTLVSEVESPDRNKHFKKFEFTVEQYRELIKIIKDAGRLFTASIWDNDLIDQLDDLVDFYKVGSGDLTALPILKKIASLNKPIIISTGLSYDYEAIETVKFLRDTNSIYKDEQMLGVLQCTSMYPINDSDANLAVMDLYKESMNVTVGYSDHTIGSKALLYSVIKGAEIIEFHFTDVKENRAFRDHQVSLTKDDVIELIEEIGLFSKLNGLKEKKPLEIEVENNHVVTFRRAVYPARDIEAGEIISESDLTVLRPNHGVDAREFYNLVGKRVKNKLYQHKAFNLSDVE